MKRTFFTLALVLGLSISGYAQKKAAEGDKFTAEIGITNSVLEEQTVWGGDPGFIPGTDTSKSWDDEALGFKVEAGYQIDPKWKVLIGWNRIEFEGERRALKAFNIVPVSLEMTDIELDTIYAGVEHTFAKAGKFDFYGTVEAGTTKVDDVSETFSVPSFNVSFTEKAYKSSRNFYYSAGVGTKFNMTENVYLDLAYQYRDFGELEATRLFKEGGYKDIDLRSHSIDFSIGVKF